jgi:hypothetical protein
MGSPKNKTAKYMQTMHNLETKGHHSGEDLGMPPAM